MKCAGPPAGHGISPTANGRYGHLRHALPLAGRLSPGGFIALVVIEFARRPAGDYWIAGYSTATMASHSCAMLSVVMPATLMRPELTA